MRPTTGSIFTIIGMRSRSRLRFLGSLLGLFSVFSLSAFAAAENGPWTLPLLMEAFRGIETAQAAFREDKSSAVLEVPLTLTGELAFRAPDYLRKTVLEPTRETYEINGDRVVISAPGRTSQTLSLDEYPLLRAFVASFRATLSGDLDTLRRYYEVELRGERAQWILTLVPKERSLAAYVDSIHIKGREAVILSVETLERGGDSSLLSLKQPIE